MSPALSSKTELVRREYGDLMKFLQRFNPSIQLKLCGRGYVECHKMNYPSLAILAYTYTPEAIIEWAKIQLLDLNIFAGVKEKMSDEQINQVSVLLCSEMHFLNIAEVALFFLKFKTGEFGELYGSVDPLKIMTAKNKFMKDRATAINQEELKLQHEERAQWRDRLEIIKKESLERIKAAKRSAIMSKKKKRTRRRK